LANNHDDRYSITIAEKILYVEQYWHPVLAYKSNYIHTISKSWISPDETITCCHGNSIERGLYPGGRRSAAMKTI
jgi:hypothetical protein